MEEMRYCWFCGKSFMADQYSAMRRFCCAKHWQRQDRAIKMLEGTHKWSNGRFVRIEEKTDAAHTA